MDPRNYIQQNRAALFDWTVIFSGFLLGFIFPTISDFIKSPGFHSWMLASFLVYSVGAALKHLPLSYRLSFHAGNPRPVPYIIFLLVGHWFIMLIIIFLSEPAIRSLAGLPALEAKNMYDDRWVVPAFFLAAIVTWMVYRSKTKQKKRKDYSANYLFCHELVADILLTASVALLSFFFWEQGVMAMLAKAKTETFGDIWFLFIFLSVLFVFFYLPLRYLFFVEDREGGRNRRRLLLIFCFMLIRAIFRMLSL